METWAIQYKQEFYTFSALATNELKQKVLEKSNIGFFSYIQTIRMLRVLGFTELAETLLTTQHQDEMIITKLIIDRPHPASDFDEKPLVYEFIENVHIPMLKELFEKKAENHYKSLPPLT